MSHDPNKAVVPETMDGWSIMHHIFSVDWTAWKAVEEAQRAEIVSEAAAYLEKAAAHKDGHSAIFSLLGHKGDLLFLNFRNTLDELNEVELGFRQLGICAYLTETTSYLSFLELGLYEMTVKYHDQLLGEGLTPGSDEWKKKWADEMADQRERTLGRLFMEIPEQRYICFYPMNKRRGEEKNWYALPIEERQMMMRDHGMVGRKYAGRVFQIITGSIGLDDWEWGVYLFAPDPHVFKELIYEMRFDEATVWYGEFGSFYSGLRFLPNQLGDFLSGRIPPLDFDA